MQYLKHTISLPYVFFYILHKGFRNKKPLLVEGLLIFIAPREARIRVRRNAYGRQNESFIVILKLHLPGGSSTAQEGVFIRAPQVVECEDDVVVLAKHKDKPVALQHRHHLITTFHPELSESPVLQQYFLSLCTADK